MDRGERKAFEWGLAPVCLGAALGVMAVLSVPAGERVVVVWQVVPDWKWFGPLVLSVPAGLSLVSLAGAAAGVRAVVLCRASSRPVAFGLAGVVLCLAAALMWAVATASWYERLQDIGAIGGMLRGRGAGGGFM